MQKHEQNSLNPKDEISYTEIPDSVLNRDVAAMIQNLEFAMGVRRVSVYQTLIPRIFEQAARAEEDGLYKGEDPYALARNVTTDYFEEYPEYRAIRDGEEMLTAAGVVLVLDESVATYA